ncbi:ribonuclease H-like domain-containing protein [Tanacetum coccineum]|uniref:Ribonuclease H-like domain-containing protein n=1 Tax=Tanacetum coccineum TaxID=301880 RepID=A0ABQ5FEL1_9ASTR
MVPKAVLMRSGLVSLTNARPVNTAQPKTTVNSARPMTNRVNTVSDKNINTARSKAVVNAARPKAVLNAVKGNQGNPQMDLQDQGVIDSGCSRHMTRNMSYLTDFEEINGGYISFGGNPKGGKITSRGSRINNMYSVDLKNIVPKGGLTCLFAKATSDESKLWHRRLGHINFKTMNKLVKGNLVRGLPSKRFENDQTCVACQKGKQHRASCKFDGKADEGFFVGYSINSKAFRVFNSRTMIVEENLDIPFSENTPNIARSGPNWIFDINALTKSMNYKPIVAGNQSNGNACTKACDDADSKSSHDAGFKPSSDDEKKVDGDPSKEDESNDQEKDGNVNSTNNVNIASDGNNTNNVNVVSSTVNTASIEVNVVGTKTSIELLDDPNMPELEDIVYSDNDEDVGAEADMNNLDSFMPVSPITTTRIHKDHPVEQIIRDLNSTPQTRRMTNNLEEHGLFSSVQQRTNHKDFQNCLFACFLSQEEPKKMDVKSAFLFGRLKRKSLLSNNSDYEDRQTFLTEVYKGQRYLNRSTKLAFGRYLKDSPFDLVAYIDSDYAGASLDRKSTIGGCLDWNGKDAKDEIRNGIEVNAGDSKLMLLGINLLLLGKVNAARHALTTDVEMKTINGEVQLQALVDRKKIIITEATIRRDLQLEYAEGIDCLSNATIFEQLTLMGVPSDNLADEDVNEENISKHSNDPLLSDEGLGEEDASKQWRKIHDIDEDITLENIHDEYMFGVHDLDGDEVIVKNVDVVKTGKETRSMVEEVTAVIEKDELVNAAKETVSAATTTTTTTITVITTVELTLAQTLAELKSARPKTRGVVMQEPSESITTTTKFPSKNKGKARIAREKEEANAALIAQWNDIQDKVETDYELAQRLQAEEQEELAIEEKSKLFVQLLEKRRKYFAAKRAEEKRNKPPTKAQQRSIMTTYLKNMAGWKPKDLKNKSFANIQELFDKAMKRVNTFVDMDTELVKESSKKSNAEIAQESSSKRVGEELESDKSKKQKLDKKVKAEVDDAKEVEELKQCLEIVPDDGDDVTVDATPLSVKMQLLTIRSTKKGR